MSGHVVIVGGGISGLAALEHLTRVAPDVRVTLVEASPRLGGLIRTHRDSGFVMEAGPDVILTAKPAALELARRVGLGDRIQSTNPAAQGSFILSDGTLRRIPDGLTGLVPSRFGPFVTTPLISPLGKARVALEYFIPPRRDAADESIAHFVGRRLGREMYERLVEPLLSGISAGDGEQLSIDAMFPQLKAYERDYGGLVRGMLARKRAPAGASRPASGGIGAFASFPAGLQELPEAVERTTRERNRSSGTTSILLGSSVQAIARGDASDMVASGARYAVALSDGRLVAADAVIVATPAFAAATLVRGLDPSLADMLEAVEYASMVTISLAFPRTALPRKLDATGYVVPRVAKRPVLACTFSSVKFDHRAPAGQALFRLFIGGVGRGNFESSSDEALERLAREELREVLGIGARPTLVQIDRFDRAMPQYTVGHTARTARIAGAAARLPGLALAGAVYGGVGIPDCVRSGVEAAGRALTALGVETPPSLATCP